MGRGNNPRNVLIDRNSTTQMQSAYRPPKRTSAEILAEFKSRITKTFQICLACENQFDKCHCAEQPDLPPPHPETEDYLEPVFLNEICGVEDTFVWDIDSPAKEKITIPAGTHVDFDQHRFLTTLGVNEERLNDRAGTYIVNILNNPEIIREAFRPVAFKFVMKPELSSQADKAKLLDYHLGLSKIIWMEGDNVRGSLMRDLDMKESGLDQILLKYVKNSPKAFSLESHSHSSK